MYYSKKDTEEAISGIPNFSELENFRILITETNCIIFFIE